MFKLFCGKGFSGLLALTILATAGGTARAADYGGTGFGNESDAARIGYDAFNLSVRKRLAATRVGLADRTFAESFSSGRAFAAAPSSRTGTVAGARRRQIDCVYHTGFTLWGDYHQTWARQGNRDDGNGYDEDGYSYRHSAPALGVDWSNGNFTAGIAGTYGWGKLKSRQYNNRRSVRSWGLQAYAQYDTSRFYGNMTVGYARNRYRSAGGDTFNWTPGAPSPTIGYVDYDARYHGNSWNADAEFGYKFRFGGARLTPNVGIRYFHDRIGDFAVQNTPYLLDVSNRNYHTLELPVGLDFSYEIAAGGTLLVPRLRAAWVPELSRKRTGWTGVLYEKGTPNSGVFGENTARRSRHGFEIGAGLEAKLTKSLSAHVDYEFGFRSKAQEHHLNVGLGFTF